MRLHSDRPVYCDHLSKLYEKNAVFEIDGESLTVLVFNHYYPSIESMITVRFGMNKERDSYDPIKRYYIQKIPVDKVIIVNI